MDSLVKTKQCFKCKRTLARTEFYAHPAMFDGLLGKCKECTRRDVRSCYRANQEKRREYERVRNSRPERRAQHRAAVQWRKENRPERYRAAYLTSNAIRDGRLVRQPCEVCGATEHIEAHHDDYSKPLDVRWLCFKCHREHEHGQIVLPRKETA